MANEALYQKYRSMTFEEVVGQEYVVRSLKNALKSGKTGHAYLFCGPRGTGKTTMARLLAKAVNCENPAEAPCGHCESCRAVTEGTHQDVVEINAANETHVENIRDLIDRAQLAPMMSRYKIYIIDEVHQLSNAAASALLKTLEEPPAHVIFILATTDPQKLLPTIISRCQRFDFAKVPEPLIMAHLQKIAAAEGFTLEDKAAQRIASLADGGMRDALSMLDQAAAFADGRITEASVDEIYGLVSAEELTDFLCEIAQGRIAEVLGRIGRCEERGTDLRRLTDDMIAALKDAAVMAYTGRADLLKKLNGEQAQQVADLCGPRTALSMIDVFMDANTAYRTAHSVKDVLEVACMRAVPESKAVIPAKTTVKTLPEAEQVSGKTDTAQAPVPPGREPEPEEMPTDPMVEEEPEEIVERPAEERAEPVELGADDVLALLVQCDKNSKADASAKLSALTGGIPDNRYAALLQQSELLAAGADCLVLGCEEEGIADRINDPEENRELYFWLNEHGIDKVPFAVIRPVYDSAVQSFIQRRKEGTLPVPKTVERYKKEEASTEKDPLQIMQDLFGDTDILEVIES